ncbi:MAG: TolC family protein [Flavobacteriaceae bacterium]
MMVKNNTLLAYCIVVLSFLNTIQAQELNNSVLKFDEYIGYVKKFHPLVKQAELVISEGQIELMKARGLFDPKIEVDYDKKEFKNTEYFNRLNTTFKIPTWYGIELKGNFEQNDGTFLNPEATVPNDGLYSAGISFSLGQGLLINKRMAAVRQAKLYRKQVKADRDLLVNKILSDASLAYFNWVRDYNEMKVYEQFLTNAQFRFESVKKNVFSGEKAPIDSIESRISMNNRKLSLVKATVKFRQSTLDLANYLWTDSMVPLELRTSVKPEEDIDNEIDRVLNINALDTNLDLENHPKLVSLDYKYQSLLVDRNLKRNMLLPKIDLEYNFLSENPNLLNSFSTTAYKGSLLVKFPLFLRKERGDLKFAKLKLESTSYEINATRLNIKNKVQGILSELRSFSNQNSITGTIVTDYEKMLNAEERKFDVGESSLFLVNSRESKLIDAKLKAIELQNKFFKTKMKLFLTLSNPIN